MTERIRLRGRLTFGDRAAMADAQALVELEADREDGVPELSRWVRVDGSTLTFEGVTHSSYAGWRALQRACREIAEYAKGGRVDLDHDRAGRVVVSPRARAKDWIDDFALVLERIKCVFGGARLDDRGLFVHLERSSGRARVAHADASTLIALWSRTFEPDEEVLFIRNRFSEVAPRLEGEGAVHRMLNVLVSPPGGGRTMRTPFRLDRGPLRALDPASVLIERSPLTSPFAAAYFLGRGLAYELRRKGANVIAADADDPHLTALR